MQSVATWMDLEIIIQSEMSQKDKYFIISLKCEILKKGTDELTCKAKIESQMQQRNLRLPRGDGMNWWTETDIYTLLYKIDS